jgi:hypothetical protein
MRMGESQRKKLKIKNGNYQCIFCGGFTPANTVDHVPPKIIFRNKSWPEGFEFPACEACNNGTSDDDLVVGLLARMTKEDSSILGLLKNIKGQHPQLLAEMLDISEAEAKVAAEKFHIEKPEGMTYRELGIVNVTDTMNLAVTTLASKLSKAVYYKLTGEIFPNKGGILFNWFTNAQLFEHGKVYVLDGLKQFKFTTEVLKRSNTLLHDQFDYRYSLSEEGTIHLLQAVFGGSFGFVTIFSPDPEIIQSIDANTLESTDHKNSAFSIIS